MARLWRAAERQAEKIEFHLKYEHQTREGRAEGLAFRDLTRILRDISAVEDTARRAAETGGVEHEQARSATSRASHAGGVDGEEQSQNLLFPLATNHDILSQAFPATGDSERP